MHLYHLTVQAPTLISHLLVGSFTGTPKQQELLLVRGDRFLEVLRVVSGKLEQIHAGEARSGTGRFSSAAVIPVFGTIRSVAVLRLPGDLIRDYLVVGSDSGATVVLTLRRDETLNVWKWERVVGMTHGRTGARRTIPGQMVAVDPRGRALVTAALEARKFAYSIGRQQPSEGASSDSTGTTISLSSPLESNRPGFLCCNVTALDAGYEHHPAFASLEVDFGSLDEAQLEQPRSPISLEALEKQLCYFEFDQGLNHLVRKWSEPVSLTTTSLIPIPGGNDGPGGVMLISLGGIIYTRPGAANEKVSLRLPSSLSQAYLTAWTLVKTKAVYFFLLQFEGGHLFKLSLEADGGKVALKLRYFDTVPLATSMGVLRSGHLFVACQAGPAHRLYQITGLADDPNEPEWTSSDMTTEADSEEIPHHPELVNLTAVDELPHFGPITDGKFMNLGNEEAPQLYLSHQESSDDGRDAAAVSVTRWGAPLEETLALQLPSELGLILGIWTLDAGTLLLSTASSSLLLKVDLETASVEQVDEETWINLNARTINAGRLQESRDLIQIHPNGLQIRNTSFNSLLEWTPGPGKEVIAAAFNDHQIVVSLNARELVMLHYRNGLLNEVTPSDDSEFPVQIGCLAIEPLQDGRLQSRWLAIGTAEDAAVRILNSETFEITAIQALTSAPVSLSLIRQSQTDLVLLVGLEDGILIQFRIDERSGALQDPSSRFVGTCDSEDCSGVRFAPVFSDKSSLLVLGSRPWWFSQDHLNRSIRVPLFFSQIQTACPLEDDLNHFAAISTDDSAGVVLRILRIQGAGSWAGPFYRHRLALPSSGMPRKLAFHQNIFAIAQGASGIALFDPFKGLTAQAIEYPAGEQVLNAAFVQFHDRPGINYLAVGGARDFQAVPRQAAESFVDLYPVDFETVSIGGRLHRTPLETPPSALTAFNGRILIAVGNEIRLCEVGKSRLLRKTQCRLASPIVSIRSQGLRLFVSTSRNSISLIVYRPDSNALIPIADDPSPRPMSADCLLDYDTVAGADRFGTFFIARLPASVSESLEQDTFLAGSGVGTDAREFLMAAPEKLEILSQFYVGDTISAMERISWAGEAGREALWYVTVTGAVGAFIPISTKSSAGLAEKLEGELRNALMNQLSPMHPKLTPQLDLLLKSQLAHRSAFAPCKSVIDGDFIEQFLLLPPQVQHEIAQTLDKSLAEVKKAIEEWRRLLGM